MISRRERQLAYIAFMDNLAYSWFEQYCRSRGGALRSSSRSVYGAWWSKYCAHLAGQGMTPLTADAAAAESFLQQLSTLNSRIRYYRLISAIYDTAVDHELCSSNPLSDLAELFNVEEEKVTVPAPGADVVASLYSIKPTAHWKKARDRALVLLAAEAGLRRNELLVLRVTDFHLEAIPAYVRVGSAASARRVELPARAAVEMRDWLSRRTAAQVQGVLMFPTDLAGNALNPSTAYRVIARYLDRVQAGKSALGASGTAVLRAGLVYRSTQEGRGLPDIQQQLGHRQLLSTADLATRLEPRSAEGESGRDDDLATSPPGL
jgi:integrase